MNLASSLWNAMGWCPMHAEPRFASPDPHDGVRIDRHDPDGGPVTRRSARYMRLAWGVLILAWAIAILALPYLPEIIPIHWGLHGEPDGFAGRLVGALGLPVILTVLMGVLLLLPRFDSVQISLAPFRDSYAIVILATVMICFCVEMMTLLVALGMDIPVVTIVPVLIGILFIVMGSLMPHIGRNTTMGIRLPWTLASDEIWRKTHEYGGRLWVAAGVIVVIGSFILGIWAIAFMLVVILGTTLYICIWSYQLAKRVPEGGQ